MGKRARHRKSASRSGSRKTASGNTPPTTAVPRPLLHTIALVLAAVGVLLTAYLTYTKMFGQSAAYCGVDSSCDLVQSSRWSTLIGMPLSLWGLLTYVLLIGLLWRMRTKPGAWRWAWAVAAFGVLFSIYLTAVSVLEIEATCIYCLTSLGLLVGLLVALSLSRPAGLPQFNWSSYVTGAGGFAVLAVVVLHMHYSGVFHPAAGPEKPYLKQLATHLNETGAVFYGAYWCPNCQTQKAMFEASVKRLPYQECTPEGRGGPRALACVTNEINAFPTWIIRGQRYEGVLEPRALASLSGFEWSE